MIINSLLFLAIFGTNYIDRPIAPTFSNAGAIISADPQDSMSVQILLIRKNYDRINSIKKWSSIRNRDLFQSTEGGVAKYYYAGNKLEKIVATDYGETYQQVTEYYLLNGQLSFAFEKHLSYNRPIYYDSTAMKDNNDTEIFDVKKTITAEARNYFEAGKLIRRLNTDKESVIMNEESLKKESARIKTDFLSLLALSKHK